MPEENEVENFWRAFAERVREIEDRMLKKRLDKADEFLEQKKGLEALGKVITAGVALLQGEADRIMDEEIERARPDDQGFTLEGHLCSHRDWLRRRAKLAADHPAVEEKILEIAGLMGDPGGEFAEKLRDECAERQERTEAEEGRKKREVTEKE